MSDKFSNIISFIIWTLPYNQDSLEVRNSFEDMWYRFDEVDQSLGNTWPSEKESDILFLQIKFFSNRLNIMIRKILSIPMSVIYPIVDRNQLMIRQSKIYSEIVFSVIGNTDIFVVMEFKDKRFK
jgi:hypothetical protein